MLLLIIRRSWKITVSTVCRYLGRYFALLCVVLTNGIIERRFPKERYAWELKLYIFWFGKCIMLFCSWHAHNETTLTYVSSSFLSLSPLSIVLWYLHYLFHPALLLVQVAHSSISNASKQSTDYFVTANN